MTTAQRERASELRIARGANFTSETTSFVARLLSGPEAETVAIGYVRANAGKRADVHYRTCVRWIIKSAVACAFFEAESRVARRTRPGESGHLW
jgi:hypothetical protein